MDLALNNLQGLIYHKLHPTCVWASPAQESELVLYSFKRSGGVLLSKNCSVMDEA